MSVNEKMTAIADNIRSKTGGTEALSLDGMASGVNEVYEAGKKAEYDDFWDTYQLNGTTPFGYGSNNFMFGNPRWNDKTFYPKHNINLTGSSQEVFMRNKCTNLKNRLEECGVRIMSSGSTPITEMTQMFRETATTELPPIYNTSPTKMILARWCENATKLKTISHYEFFKVTSDMTQMCTGCSSLETIEGIDFSGLTKTPSSIFSNCSKLANITVHGNIPLSISFSSSPLTVESMKSVITHLKDYSGTSNEFTYKVTFSSACITALEAEGATSPNGNLWTDYINDLGWNYN